MYHKTLLAFLLTASFLCSGKTIINFSDPLESPRPVHNGIFKMPAQSKGKSSIFFSTYGSFLPLFNRGEVVLTAIPEKPLSFSLITQDRQNRRFIFPLTGTQAENGIMKFTAVIDSSVPFPFIQNGKAGKRIPEQPLRIMALEIQGEKATVNLKSLDFFERGIMVFMKTGNSVPVLNLNKNTGPNLEAANHSNVPGKITVNYSVKDISGTDVDSGKKELSLKPGEKKSVPLKRPALQGVYTVNYTFSKPDVPLSFRERFAAIIPAERKKTLVKNRFALGFCTHFHRYEKQDVEKMVQLLALCGTDEVRLGWLWSQINPNRNVWDFARIDWIIGLLEKQNIGMLALMGAAPKYAETTGYRRTNIKAALHLPRTEYFEEWLRRFATHYNGRIGKFGVWNEPDIAHFADFEPEEYLRLQQSAYRALKSVNPGNEVIAGGFSNILKPYGRKVLELMAKETSPSADTVSTHLYASLGRFPEVLDNCRRLMKTLGLKQKLCTEETGAGTTDDLEQAIVLFQKVIQCRAEGISIFHWYNLRNCGFNAKDKEDNFGLLEHDLNPRAGYVTFNMLSGLYGNAGFVRKELRTDFYAARFESPDSALYALWLRKENQINTFALFETNAKRVERIDLFGNIQPLTLENGVFAAPVDTMGQTLRLFPAKANLKLRGDALLPESPLLINPGEEKEFSFLCNLPGNVSLQAFPGDQLSVSPAVKESSGRFRIPVKATKQFRLENSRVFKVQILRDGKKTGKPLEFNFRKVYKIPHGKMTKIGSIARRTQVRNMLPETPEYGKYFWTGPRDCSVAFGATAGKTTLHFQIGMNDDIHVQEFPAEELWKGDSIQLALQFPGQKDYWELGIAMTNGGKLLKHIWRAPKGMDLRKALDGIRVSGKKLEGSHNFHLFLSLPAFGTSVEALQKEGVYFNLLANDNDGEFRKTQLSFTGREGTDPEKRIMAESPLLTVE